MTVPALIPAEGTVISVRPSVAYTPWTPNWWQQSTITRVPETSVGWLVAQGWQIVNTYAETAGGQTFYTMARQSMQSWVILQTLLSEYVQKYNEANAANVIRYENIISLWTETIQKTRQQMDVQGDVSDGHITVYVSQMDDMVTSVEDEMALALSAGTAAGAIVAAQLADYLVKLATLEGIYATHEADAEALLVNLGVTELARINEQFDAALAKNLQALTDRGLYSSAIVTAITARITRERTEAISLLNDRLAREKLENEHKLYAQEMDMLGMVLDGKLKNASVQFQYGQYLVELRTKCALTIMQARMQRINGRMDIRDREEKLMAYQLDTRNNLIIGLFNFMEKREDVGPSMQDITQLIVGLGDQSGTSFIQT
jgi:hypothetical protein